jgi:hypothetical protein
MRTSLNEIKEIEDYLCNNLNTGDRLIFEARMLLSKKLRKDVELQRKAYSIIQHHYRATLRQQLNVIHDRLFHDPSRKAITKEIINTFKS